MHLGLGGDAGVIKEVLLCVELGEVGAPVQDLRLDGLVGAWRRGDSALTVCLLLGDDPRGGRRRRSDEVALILVLN